ncbi:MAG: YbfB/YjiJ family MFS transporter [Candidatus Eremiobacteraeota bacterium]|nr:YbfB/YjiJ family MFS transporter [Candidatus Eremiobacteraeota bacterium]
MGTAHNALIFPSYVVRPRTCRVYDTRHMVAIASRPVRTTVAAMSALVVAMSISRFAYTPILPVMIEQHALSHEFGALLASVNLLGYLAGAVLASTHWAHRHRTGALKWSLAAIVVTLALMAVPNAGTLWSLARFVSGVASAFVFVLASSLVLDLRHTPHATALFSSVGAGIALTGIVIPIAYRISPDWTTGWIVTTAIAVVLSIVTAALLIELPSSNVTHLSAAPSRLSVRGAIVLACYGIAGFAYVIPATFLVVLVASAPALRAYAFATWIVVGVFACATTFLWGPLSTRFGKGATLSAALLLLAVSCAAPVSGNGLLPALVASFSLGASFMAVSMLAIGIVRDLEPHQSSRRIGQATAIFGIGQVLGPAFTGLLYASLHSYGPAFIAATGLLVLASACIAITFRQREVQ